MSNYTPRSASSVLLSSLLLASQIYASDCTKNTSDFQIKLSTEFGSSVIVRGTDETNGAFGMISHTDLAYTMGAFEVGAYAYVNSAANGTAYEPGLSVAYSMGALSLSGHISQRSNTEENATTDFYGVNVGYDYSFSDYGITVGMDLGMEKSSEYDGADWGFTGFTSGFNVSYDLYESLTVEAAVGYQHFGLDSVDFENQVVWSTGFGFDYKLSDEILATLTAGTLSGIRNDDDSDDASNSFVSLKTSFSF